jgi:hypothetical protein
VRSALQQEFIVQPDYAVHIMLNHAYVEALFVEHRPVCVLATHVTHNLPAPSLTAGML